MLQRYWRAWSTQPPPLALQQLLDALSLGVPLPRVAQRDNLRRKQEGKRLKSIYFPQIKYFEAIDSYNEYIEIVKYIAIRTIYFTIDVSI
jgi:hypothetical protein